MGKSQPLNPIMINNKDSTQRVSSILILVLVQWFTLSWMKLSPLTVNPKPSLQIVASFTSSQQDTTSLAGRIQSMARGDSASFVLRGLLPKPEINFHAGMLAGVTLGTEPDRINCGFDMVRSQRHGIWTVDTEQRLHLSRCIRLRHLRPDHSSTSRGCSCFHGGGMAEDAPERSRSTLRLLQGSRQEMQGMRLGGNGLCDNAGSSSSVGTGKPGSSSGIKLQIRYVLEQLEAEFYGLSWLTISPMYLHWHPVLPYHCGVVLRLEKLLYYPKAPPPPPPPPL
ncbi:hypothetical protein SELMODRAFT_405423 [Selaginella moellendorffii]|uniref:Uncharacterized protein n=1 Tax=Selaginella moellendorffii TaxID=88036 RepID=D8QXB2_SELML|nr:hypothetical protein SELMODRAFT_405423 [Selaginella moellendorffii]